MDFRYPNLQIGSRRNFARTGDTLLADERPWEAALNWLSSKPGMVTTWAVNDNKILPTPLDDGARDLKAYLQTRTGDAHSIAEAIAHLFDNAHALGHAVWCWQEGATDYMRVEPKPVWVAA